MGWAATRTALPLRAPACPYAHNPATTPLLSRFPGCQHLQYPAPEDAPRRKIPLCGVRPGAESRCLRCPPAPNPASAGDPTRAIPLFPPEIFFCTVDRGTSLGEILRPGFVTKSRAPASLCQV